MSASPCTSRGQTGTEVKARNETLHTCKCLSSCPMIVLCSYLLYWKITLSTTPHERSGMLPRKLQKNIFMLNKIQINQNSGCCVNSADDEHFIFHMLACWFSHLLCFYSMMSVTSSLFPALCNWCSNKCCLKSPLRMKTVEMQIAKNYRIQEFRDWIF